MCWYEVGRFPYHLDGDQPIIWAGYDQLWIPKKHLTKVTVYT